MDTKIYTFNCVSEYSVRGISSALENLVCGKETVFVCVGSDLVVGDCLGPLCGTYIKNNIQNTYVYGTLDLPITAKQINSVSANIKKLHPNSCVVVVDACVGTEEEIGLIKVQNKGIKPGLGVNKNLRSIGDVSIVGVVAEKTYNNYPLYNFTRLGLVDRLSKTISDGIKLFCENRRAQIRLKDKKIAQ